MAKLSSNSSSTKKNKKSGGGIIGKLQKSLSKMGDDDSSSTYRDVPKDVKEGHFAVLAVDDQEPKRFVVPLTYLSNPAFLKLLERAAEEYGFDHGGALTIPCRPRELEMILNERSYTTRPPLQSY